MNRLWSVSSLASPETANTLSQNFEVGLSPCKWQTHGLYNFQILQASKNISFYGKILKSQLTAAKDCTNSEIAVFATFLKGFFQEEHQKMTIFLYPWFILGMPPKRNTFVR